MFDISSNDNTPYVYSQFFAVNPRGYTADDLKYLDANPFIEMVNGVEEIRAITWRLDNQDHHIHIHEMFMFVLQGRA